MFIKKIYEILDNLSPFSSQASWDNSGIQVAQEEQEINKIYLSLDISSDMIDKLEENSLIITHHPLIFSAIKSINQNQFPSNIIHKLIQKNISCIAMHTNYDKSHLNKYVVNNILGYEILHSDEFTIYFVVKKNFDEFCDDIKRKFGLKHINIVKNTKFVNIAAITTGSGASLLKNITTDCFLTGDIKYHDAMLSCELGKSLIDIKHYESEIFFAQSLKNELENYNIDCTITNSQNPFTIR